MFATASTAPVALPRKATNLAKSTTANRGWLRSVIDWLLGRGKLEATTARAEIPVLPIKPSIATNARSSSMLQTTARTEPTPALAPNASRSPAPRNACWTRQGGWRAQLPIRLRAVSANNKPMARQHKSCLVKHTHPRVVWMASRSPNPKVTGSSDCER